MNETVLVTGATGDVGLHLLPLLLDKGFEVRAAVASVEDARALLDQAAPDDSRIRDLPLFEIALESHDGWSEAVTGCHYVVHLAAPPKSLMARRPDVYGPIVEDACMRLLRAARNEFNMKHVIVSSIVRTVVGDLAGPPDKIYSEADWADELGLVQAGGITDVMTRMERSAWRYVAEDGRGLRLTTVLPGLTFGPLRSTRLSRGPRLVHEIATRALPAFPEFGIVAADVRDVARTFEKALTSGEGGQRIIAANDFIWVSEIKQILNESFPEIGAAGKIVTLPDFLRRPLALLNPQLRALMQDMDAVKHVDTSRMKQILGTSPIPARDSIIDTIRSLRALNLC